MATHPDLMAVFYAAVTSIEEGKIGEVEIESRVEEGDMIVALVISVRRDVKHFQISDRG